MRSRLIFVLIAGAGFFCALAGLWFEGFRNEVQIAKLLHTAQVREQTPFYRSPDSFYWVSYAREMIDRGEVRVRFTHMDNAPYGRPNVNWASLNAWYLVGLAKIWSLLSGLPTRDALPLAAVWASPILYLFALAIMLVAGWRTKNFAAATAAVVVFGTAPRVYDDFAYAVPGHHGWHDLFCFSTILCLAIAIRKVRSHFWFALAGLSAAIAIWIGATQQVFGLAAAGLAILLGIFLARSDHTAIAQAESWRWFGWIGGIASLILYLLEYAPDFRMQLEVNHPIYSFAFVAGGEFLCRLQRLIPSKHGYKRVDILVSVAAVISLCAIAAALFVGPAQWHTLHQPFIQRLHREVAEFQPIIRTNGFEWILILGAPIAFVIVGSMHAFKSDRKIAERVALLVCIFPCAVAIALSFLQFRWAGIAGASAAALAAILFTDQADDRLVPTADAIKTNLRSQFQKMPIPQFICISLSLILVSFWYLRRNNDNAGEIRAEALDRIATIELAGILESQAVANSPPIVLFSDQKSRQAWISYVTNIPGVGSLYWDSPRGLSDEAEFLATYDDEVAHRIARERGITYVITSPNAGSVIAYHYLWQGNRTAPQIRQTLAYRLAAPQPAPPFWLQLEPALPGVVAAEGIRIYRVL